MKEHIIKELSNKSILILGFGREGRSTYRFIIENNINCKLGIADILDILDEKIVNNKDITLHTGKDYLDAIYQYDIVLKSPGVSLKDVNIDKIRDKITSQTEFFLKYAGHKIIGITGTKGKSTTSSMIYSILKEESNVLLVGNIGVPAFEMIDSYDKIDWYIYELSSHQLELVKYSPYIAIFLNIYPEHLDYYKSYEAYVNAKKNIYKYQTKKDWYIYNHDIETLLEENDMKQNLVNITKNKGLSGNTTYFTDESIVVNINGEEKIISIPLGNKNIIGDHNKFNLSVAITVASIIGENQGKIEEGIKSFKSLPHRMEKIGTYNGITYLDDSIATIPQATKWAIESIDNIDTIIIGGMDRGLDYKEFANYLATSKVKNIILTYDSGKKIYEMLSNMDTKNNIMYVNGLEEAVNIACKITSKGKSCLLSPAAASYGVFKNYEEKGCKFKDLVIKANLSTNS